MKCEDFINKLEYPAREDLSEDMLNHIAECDDCRGYLEELISLRPTVSPEAPKDIKQNVLAQIKRRETFKTKITMKKISKVVASLAGAAMVAVMIFFAARPVDARAAAIIDQSIQGVAKAQSMVMKVNMRMGENSGFVASTNPNDEMIEVTLAMKRNPTVWRIEKKQDKDKAVIFDGVKKYLLFPKFKEGFIGTADYNFEDDMGTLLNPEMYLMQEQLSIRESYAKYTIRETGKEIIMTAKVEPQGDYSESDYMLNKSINTSQSRRVIIFDKKTKLLKGLQIYVDRGGDELLVVDVKEIKYDVPLDAAELTKLPEGYVWVDDTKPESIKLSGNFMGISAEEAAKRLFKGIADHDFESVKDAFIQYPNANADYIQRFFKPGVEVLEVGKPFKSGLYPGVFIPYKIKFSDGTIKENHPLPIRNDDAGYGYGWHIDGGI